ncbi:nuclear transport factor 2 family protein [Maricaulis maris]|uniref:Ketosteroid isomerase-like protein n=1 Tax=Maricaulis maris TaxID=74318 RepID=A0A495DM13_9PROT|nr:nuclear transport factor 2 family protein [Maricaulis maris]RKR03962.1 ketosteroid isomerase-like protein [Maricaulis maris]
MSAILAALILVAQPASDATLHDTISALDAAMFEAFNSCDGEEFGTFIAEDIEFYHDLDGLNRDRDSLIQAVNTSICGNFRRQLTPGSIEVWPLPGYGAIESGWHAFINYGADEPHGQGRFLHIWRQDEDGWKITRIVSYDHGPFDGAGR